MATKPLLTNTYIPTKNIKGKYEWYDHDLMTNFEDIKYDKFVSDMDSYLNNAQVINFDIIHYVCRGDKLQNPEKYYKTIRNKGINNYEQYIQSNAISSAIKPERDDIHFEHKVLSDYFQEKTMFENTLPSNGFFLKKKAQPILQN